MSNINANRGYVGFSMSVRANEAYKNLDMPKTAFKKHYGISEKVFQSLVNSVDSDNDYLEASWHHTSRFFNETNFYKLTDYGLCHLASLGNKVAIEQLDYEVEVIVDKICAKEFNANILYVNRFSFEYTSVGEHKFWLYFESCKQQHNDPKNKKYGLYPIFDQLKEQNHEWA